METVISISHGKTDLNNVKILRGLHPSNQMNYISQLFTAVAGGSVTRLDESIISGGEKAEGMIELTGNPTSGNTVTIGGLVYTFRTELTSAPRDVLIGEDVDATTINLAGAIEGSSFGEYSGATKKNPMVSAVIGNPGVILLRARIPGTIGNLVVVERVGASITVTTMAGGVDGEVA